jgi:predicted metal-dependent peptidase
MPEAGDLYCHRGTRAIQRMVEFAPSTGGLALWVRHVDLGRDEVARDDVAKHAAARDAKAPAIATDGNALYYGARFDALPLGEQTGLVAHEVLHIALRHPQRLLDLQELVGDVDLRLFNICADAIVNSTLSHLTWLTLPPNAVFLDRLLAIALSEKRTVEQALLEWDVEKLYRAIDDRRVGARGGWQKNRHERGGGAGASSGGTGRSGADQPHADESRAETQRAESREDGPRAARVRMMGGETPVDLIPAPHRSTTPETLAEEARTWSERLLRAHAGDGVHSMLRTLIADVPRTRTPWEQVLRAQLAHSLAPKPGISWSRPSRSYIANQGRAGPGRRLPWTPGFSSLKPSPHLVVIVDVSGSIEDTLLEKFAREIEAITRRQEAALVLVVGDDQVRRVTEFAPGRSDLRDIEFAGGGGTDFTPLLEEAEKHRPDIVVVLTDLDGPANFRPRWPVIWAVPEACASAVQPFGRKLTLS